MTYSVASTSTVVAVACIFTFLENLFPVPLNLSLVALIMTMALFSTGPLNPCPNLLKEDFGAKDEDREVTGIEALGAGVNLDLETEFDCSIFIERESGCTAEVLMVDEVLPIF